MIAQPAIRYAGIFGTLKQKCTPIPVNDIWIAAVTCIFFIIEVLPFNQAR